MRTLVIIFLMYVGVYANDGATLFSKCVGCHGVHAEKKAMNISGVINTFSKESIAKAIRGYQTGTYGGKMRGVMRAQVARLNQEQIDTLATYIATLATTK